MSDRLALANAIEDAGIERSKAVAMLRAACKEAGSAVRLAKAHNLNHSYISGVLRGRQSLGPKIAAILGLPPIPRVPRQTKWNNFDNCYLPEPNSGCWLWEGTIDPNGYGRLKDPTGRLTRAHRASFLKVHGSIPDGMDVLHRCDVRCCVNPDHLFLGTAADNAHDKIKKGRQRVSHGEVHGSAKLTVAAMLAIRASSEPTRTLVARYGIDRTNVWQIRTGKGWRHIPWPATKADLQMMETRLMAAIKGRAG